MMISNDGGFAGATWEPYSATKPWTITGYGAYVIPRIVYARYKDSQGEVYGPYIDDIIYDPIPPMGSVSISGAGDTVTLILNASDDNSGVDKMIISNTPSFAGASWEDYAQTKQWTLGTDRTVYARYKDKAGNPSAIYSATQHQAYLPFVVKNTGGLQSESFKLSLIDRIRELLSWKR